MARRVMHEFELDEISAVDVPAQEGARKTLMKRDDVEKTMTRPMRTGVRLGHAHLIDAVGSSGQTTFEITEGEEGSHNHSWLRLPSGEIEILDSEGHGHEVIDDFVVERRAPESEPESTQKAAGAPVDGPSTGETMTKTEKTAERDEAVERVDALEKQLARAEKLVELTDAQRAFWKSLDEEERESFLGKTSEERDAAIDVTKGEDPIVYTTDDGTSYRKSDDPRTVSLAKALDDERRQRKAAEAARKNAEFEKRAEVELANLPGEPVAKTALLKAIDSISDAGLRQKVTEIIHAGNSRVADAFVTMGTVKKSDADNAEDKLDDLAKARQSAHPELTFEKAYAQVLKTEEGKRLYRQTRES